MNERILELAIEARKYAESKPDIYQVAYDKKFAELIVRECLDQCYNRGMNDALYEGQLKAAKYIEEHFGIEQ